jgi:hypothetical protein
MSYSPKYVALVMLEGALEIRKLSAMKAFNLGRASPVYSSEPGKAYKRTIDATNRAFKSYVAEAKAAQR